MHASLRSHRRLPCASGSKAGQVLGFVLAATLLAAGAECNAAVGGTATSSKPVSKPSYYRGDLPSGSGATAFLPVTVAPSPGIPATWLPIAALERLASEATTRVTGLEGVVTIGPAPAAPKSVAPEVYLGCAVEEATEECSDEARENILAVTSGSKEWRQWLNSAAETVEADRILVLQLQVAPHWIRQRGLKGSKEAPLGTGHVQALPWLTSLDTPVYVLQLSGAVVDVEGKVLRSGAEGIWALRTPFRVSVLGAQRLLSEEDVDFVRQDLRRTDLPGSPLAWEAALDELVSQLGAPGRRTTSAAGD